MIFCGNSNKNSKKLTNFANILNWERCEGLFILFYLVDLEKSYKMSIWLQKSASIQKRTSPLKFDHFRYPKPDFTASDLSTKPCTGANPKDSSGCVGRLVLPWLSAFVERSDQ